VLLIVSFSGEVGQAPPQALGSLQLELRPLRDSLRQGDVIVVEARVTNTSATPVNAIVPLVWPSAGFRVSVEAERGHYMSTLDFNYSDDVLLARRDLFETRLPSQTFIGRDLVLGGAHVAKGPRLAFAESGSYRISASLQVADVKGRTFITLTSDTVTIILTR
jgi:hypothetical protein